MIFLFYKVIENITLGLKIWPSYTPCKKEKNEPDWTLNLGGYFYLAVECLYRDTNLCKLEVHSIFAIFAIEKRF